MTKGIYTIAENVLIADHVYQMTLMGDTSAITAPGQFVNIQLDGFYLRRPISICDWNEESIRIIYKVVGQGTEAMAKMTAGQTLDVLVGLGNGFDVTTTGDAPLLVGGGVGVPPMYGLAKRLVAEGKKPVVVMGFAGAKDAFYMDEFMALGCETRVATVDGSLGTKGFVTDVIAKLEGYTSFCACGPIPMLKAVSDTCPTSGQLSFEERMGCGFGACMGCSCKTKYGNKRICKDGPVLVKEEVIW